MPRTFALSFHASYGCRERGACCTAGWPIPIEADNLTRVEAALAQHVIPAPRAVTFFAKPTNMSSDAPTLIAVRDGVCAFHAAEGSARCTIQRHLGHAALPLACRQFPRVTVHDPRGTSVTLSHYCPTAADLLTDDLPLTIDDEPQAFPADGEYVGLEATGGLPPLLTRTVLMDWESWWAFEREAVALIAEATTPAEALARLGTFVAAATTWRPGGDTLYSHIEGSARTARLGAHAFVTRADDAVERVRAAIPKSYRPPVPARCAAVVTSHVWLRFLAAHAFANWAIHLGTGLESWLRSLELADGLLAHGFTVAQADLWLRHLADGAELCGGK